MSRIAALIRRVELGGVVVASVGLVFAAARLAGLL